MNINGSKFTSIEQVTGKYLNQQEPAKKTGNVEQKSDFAQVLRSKTLQEQMARVQDAGALKFSRHANERLLSRNIDLSEEQMERLCDGTERARQKGIKESLVMVDNLAFIVNVRNNTVVTAVGDSEDKIFTNIDGAVIS